MDPGPGNEHATPAENERFREFLGRLDAEGFSSATKACYASDWWTTSETAHGLFGARFRLDRYTPERFRRQRDVRIRSGVSPATMNRRLAFLRRYTAFAADREPALRPLAEAFSRLPFLAVARRPGRALAQDQEERLRAAAQAAGPVEHAVVALLLSTGMRASEAAALLRSDLSGPERAPNVLRVRGARRKTFVLAPPAARALGEAIERDPGPAEEPVFRRGPGRALGPSGIAAAVARAAQAAGVPATPRTLRHTFAMRYLAEHGNDVDGLSRALGQQSRAAARAYRDESGTGEPSVRVVRWPEGAGGADGAGGAGGGVVAGDRFEAVRAVLQPGAPETERSYVAERMTFVVRGEVEVVSGSLRVRARAGEVVTVPPGVAHSIAAAGRSPAVTISVFAPRGRRGS